MNINLKIPQNSLLFGLFAETLLWDVLATLSVRAADGETVPEGLYWSNLTNIQGPYDLFQLLKMHFGCKIQILHTKSILSN